MTHSYGNNKDSLVPTIGLYGLYGLSKQLKKGTYYCTAASDGTIEVSDFDEKMKRKLKNLSIAPTRRRWLEYRAAYQHQF